METLLDGYVMLCIVAYLIVLGLLVAISVNIFDVNKSLERIEDKLNAIYKIAALPDKDMEDDIVPLQSLTPPIIHKVKSKKKGKKK